MYNTCFLIIYPLPTSHLNSNWWSYPCILSLIFNIAWSFKFFVGRKENHFNLFYHVVYQGNSIRHEWCAKKLLVCQILQRTCNGTTSLSTQMLIFWQRHWDNPQRVFRQERSFKWEIYLYDALVASLIITLTFHCTLHLIHNEWSRRLEKRRGNIKRFSTLSWSWLSL